MCEKVALVLPDLMGGGTERVMLDLAEEISRRGYEVDLVVAVRRGGLLDQVPAGVRFVNLGARRIIFSLPALIRYFRREGPGAVLSALPAMNCLAVFARSLSGVSTRLILSQHGTESLLQETIKNRRSWVLSWLIRLTYPKADGLVAVSGGVADHLARATKLKREKIEVIYNPVVGPRMATLMQERVSNTWFGGGEPPVILGVGRLTCQKDFPTLIKAFSIIRQNFHVRLIILGEGEERANLECLVADLGLEPDVALPGFVRNPYPYMRAASIFALSSRWEGLGNVLIEAMACGTPVVSTDCPSGPAEILEGGRWGRLVPVGDFAALAKMIEETLEGGSVAPPGVEKRLQEFSVKSAVDRYCDKLFARSKVL